MASMKRYYNPGTGELEYMPGFDDNSPLTATEKLMADGLKKKPLTKTQYHECFIKVLSYVAQIFVALFFIAILIYTIF